eukprot:scaffold7052_cov254-Pinguiococcus_pyrenoidosus.AAC.87
MLLRDDLPARAPLPHSRGEREVFVEPPLLVLPSPALERLHEAPDAVVRRVVRHEPLEACLALQRGSTGQEIRDDDVPSDVLLPLPGLPNATLEAAILRGRKHGHHDALEAPIPRRPLRCGGWFARAELLVEARVALHENRPRFRANSPRHRDAAGGFRRGLDALDEIRRAPHGR